MTLRLTVDHGTWLGHVHKTAAAFGDVDHLLPVAKGNGYGFGRPILIEQAVTLAREIAVGTVFEAHDVPPSHTPIVLTPAGNELPKSLPDNAVLVVGSVDNVRSLVAQGWSGRVLIKLRSSMQRYGTTAQDLRSVVDEVAAAGFVQHGWSIHPPLSGSSSEHAKEIGRWLGVVPNKSSMYVSHVDATDLNNLRDAHPDVNIVARVGTALWLGDKSMLKLGVDVLDISRVSGGTAGYRNTPIHGKGSIVVVGCGSSHGVGELDDGLSPFHFAKQRISMLEPPHMHSTMLFVSDGNDCPTIADTVDVQQPMSRVQVDAITWA